jgi:predicted porin
VQLYGKLYPWELREMLSTGTVAGGGTVSSTLNASRDEAQNSTHMQSGNSNFGLRGSENLGGGNKAIFQFESQLALEDGSTNAKFWSRNTFVGFTGPWGTVKLGKYDTVLKEYGDTIGFLGVSSGSFTSSSNIFRMPGFGNSSQSRFHDRAETMIRYDSPVMSGFQFAILYSNNSTDKTQNVADRAPKNLSLGVQWDNGPIYLALAHEIHWNNFGGSSNVGGSMRNYATVGGAAVGGGSKDQATQATVEWRINKQHRVEFDVLRKSYTEDDARWLTGNTRSFKSYSNLAYLFAFENKWTSSFTTAGHIAYSAKGSCALYSNNNAPCVTDGLAGTRYQLGGAYNLSKRTMLYGAMVYIHNEKSSSFNNGYAKVAAGQNVRQLGIGISHRF